MYVGIHFSINILQAGSWPLGPTAIPPLSVPQELEKCIHLFEKFYHGQFNGRKLSWLHNISQGEEEYRINDKWEHLAGILIYLFLTYRYKNQSTGTNPRYQSQNKVELPTEKNFFFFYMYLNF